MILKRKKKKPLSIDPCIIPRKKHSVSRKDISQNACRVLYRLKEAGYEAYLVGGGVRDLLLGIKPKDFDVVTNALPEEIRKVFRNSRIIGRRFRLVHVQFREEIIEVSTFRANVSDLKEVDILSADNTYGTIEEDAWRRDFTVNALFYRVSDFSVVDYTNGMSDLKRKTLRIIGDPWQRFHEDPVRLLRAIRLAAKLNFKIHKVTREPLLKLMDLLEHVPDARLLDEILKLFFTGHAEASYQGLKRTGYLRALFPMTVTVIDSYPRRYFAKLLLSSMKITDERLREQKSLNPAFLFAVLLWPVVQYLTEEEYNKHGKMYQALYAGINIALQRQSAVFRLPRRMTAMMRAIWVMQYHLERQRPSRILRLLNQRFFRAGFDFLLLRADAGEKVKDKAQFWDTIQKAKSSTARKKLIDTLTSEPKR